MSIRPFVPVYMRTGEPVKTGDVIRWLGCDRIVTGWSAGLNTVYFATGLEVSPAGAVGIKFTRLVE